MKLFSSFILSIFFSNVGICCSCVQVGKFSIKKEYQDRDVIFRGTLRSIDTVEAINSIQKFTMHEIWYTFEVTEYYKGKTEKYSIRIRSGITEAADCKYIFYLNESYIVYANNNSKDKTILDTSICTHTGIATRERISEARKQSDYY